MERKKRKKSQFWSKENDIALHKWVESNEREYGQRYKWREARALFPDFRESRKIRTRWVYVLHPSNKKGKWSADEDMMVVKEFFNGVEYPKFSLDSNNPRRQKVCRIARFVAITNCLKKNFPNRHPTSYLYEQVVRIIHQNDNQPVVFVDKKERRKEMQKLRQQKKAEERRNKRYLTIIGNEIVNNENRDECKK